MSKKIYQIPNIICRNVIAAHDSPIEAVLVRDKFIISACRRGLIKIWDLNTGDLIRTLSGHTDQINSLACYQGAIYSASNDNTIRKWSLESGECRKVYQGHQKSVLSVTIENNMLISGSDDATIKIWDENTGENIKTLRIHNRSVSAVKALNGKIYTASWDHKLCVLNAESLEVEGEFEEHFDAINCLDASDDYIVTGDQTGYVNIWDAKKLELLHHLKHHRLGIMNLKISQNYLYSTSKDKTVLITDLETGVKVKKLQGHIDATVGIDKEKNIIVSSSADKTIRIWDDFTLHSKRAIQAHDGIVLGTKAIGDKIISAGTDNVIKIWDKNSGALLKSLPLAYKSWVWGLAVGDNRVLASCDDGIYVLYDIDTGQKIVELKGHKGKVYRAMMRGDKAITSGWDNTSRVWDLNTGNCLTILKGHTYAVYSSVIAEDGTYITGSSDGTIRTWDTTGRELLRINFHQDEVFHLETQGDLVVSASGDGTCGVFNYKTGEVVAIFDDHTDQVWTVLIHKGLVFTGSADNTIKIWDLKTAECLDTLEGHTDNVKDLAISGCHLISGSLDSSIRIWDIQKYYDDIAEIDEQITRDLETLVAQIQMATTYDMVPEEMGQPGLIRILYGMNPLDDDQSYRDEKLVVSLKETAQSWHNLGKLGYAPWLSDIPRGIKAGSIQIDDDETLDIVVQEFMNGFRENGSLFWMGLLRRYGNRLETLLPEKWTYRLDYSGQGPNPVEGYQWTRLGAKLNRVKLEDREETALIFRLTLENVNEWILPLIKAFEIQIKDDRGDVGYINFSNFLPDDEGNWCATGMFKIDSGYKMEPNALLYFTDVEVIYESRLAPSFQGTNVLKQISIIRGANEEIRAKIDALQQQIIILSENITDIDFGAIVPKGKRRKASLKTVLPGYELTNLYTSPKAKKIFKRVETQYQGPAIGTLNIKIGEKFNKFLEYIQPKFILFTSGSTIAGAVLAILFYIQAFVNVDLLGQQNDIAGITITVTEIILYSIIYGILILILVVSISSWLRYQRQKKRN